MVEMTVLIALTIRYPTIGQKIFGPSAGGFVGTNNLTPFFTGTLPFISGFTFHDYPFYQCSLDVYVVKSGTSRIYIIGMLVIMYFRSGKY